MIDEFLIFYNGELKGCTETKAKAKNKIRRFVLDYGINVNLIKLLHKKNNEYIILPITKEDIVMEEE